MWRLASFLLFSLFILCGKARSYAGRSDTLTVSHQLSDGAIIDCIRIEDQPSLQYAHMKNHKIEKSPPKPMNPDGFSDMDKAKRRRKTQLFHHEVGSCEEGFIPILRSRGNDDRTAFSSASNKGNAAAVLESETWSYTAKAQKGGPNTGGSAYIQLPHIQEVDNFNDMSMASISILATHCTSPNASEAGGPNGAEPSAGEIMPNWLEAGYMVAPMVYMFTHAEEGAAASSEVQKLRIPKLDNNIHFYIYSKGFKDDPKRSCLNLECGGFVQVSQHMVVGGRVAQTTPLFVHFELYFSQPDESIPGKWWLYYDSEVVGYWPQESIYHGASCLQTGGDLVQWGGQVVLASPTSRTGMGSGSKGSTGFGHAAYIANVRAYVPPQCPAGRPRCGESVAYVPVEADITFQQDDPAHFDAVADYNNTYNNFLPLFTGVYYGGSLGSAA